MGIEVLDKPDISETDNDEPKLAHIISKDDEMNGYFYGKEVQALCGHRFIPTRDPKKFPTCAACKEVLAQMIRGI